MVPRSPATTTREVAPTIRALAQLILPWKAASALFISRDPPVERTDFLTFAYWVRPLIGWTCIVYAAIRFHVATGPETDRQRELAVLECTGSPK